MNGPPRLIHKETNKIFGYQCFIPDLTLHCQTIVDIQNIVKHWISNIKFDNVYMSYCR